MVPGVVTVTQRNLGRIGLLVMLGALGAFIVLMGLGILVQNVGCGCVVAGTPEWAWLLAPVLVIVAGGIVLGCAVVWFRTPSPEFRRNATMSLIATAAVECAALLGTSRALTPTPNEAVLIPVTAAVVVVAAVAVLGFRAFGARGRPLTA